MKVFFRIMLLLLASACSSSATKVNPCNSTCQQAFDFVVSHEDYHLTGVVSREPFGGVARFGVNSLAHPEAVRAGFYKMPRGRALVYARRLFYFGYWKPMHCNDIRDSRLANKIADIAYNVGIGRAAVLLKRSVIVFGVTLTAKGWMTPEVVEAVNSVPARELEIVLKYQTLGFYSRLAQRHVACRQWKPVWIARTLEG